MNLEALKWDEKGLLPVVFQDQETGEVLNLSYLNREALEKTLETGKVHVFRRSRGRVMMKGEVSGNCQLVKDMLVDCDADALVMKVAQVGGAACAEGYRSCFYRRPKDGAFAVVQERVFDPEEVYAEGAGR